MTDSLHRILSLRTLMDTWGDVTRRSLSLCGGQSAQCYFIQVGDDRPLHQLLASALWRLFGNM
jgi:hypothetical protein